MGRGDITTVPTAAQGEALLSGRMEVQEAGARALQSHTVRASHSVLPDFRVHT